MEEIRIYFEKHYGISSSDWTVFSSKLRQKDFKKKETLLDVGQVENYLSYVQRGIIRQYIPLENVDLTFGFVFGGSFVSGYDSFLLQKPSEYRLEALTEGVLWQLSYHDLQEVYKSSRIGNFIGRKASEELYLKKSKREISLLQDSAEERYLKLFEERPELLRKIPLKYIASYIGVTPQALSRIRRRIS